MTSAREENASIVKRIENMDDDTLFNVQLCKSLKHKNGLCLVIDTEEEVGNPKSKK